MKCGGEKMKTTNNFRYACRMAAVLGAVILFSTTAFAQPKPDASVNDEVKAAFASLEVLMASTENAIRYVAPSVESDDIRLARERLEWLANKIEAEIRYTPAEEQQVNAVEFAEGENNQGSETLNVMTFNTAFTVK